MITFQNVYKEYRNGVLALADINLEIPNGDFAFLMGPSGAGKSTIIRSLIREIEVTRGSILVDGMDVTRLSKRRIPELRRHVGVVFQDFRLLPKKTVYENIAYALEIRGESRRETKKRVEEVLEIVNLPQKGRCYPSEISGGESQRVSIARALVGRPKVLICDEPTGNLDFETSKEIMQALETANRAGTTILMATHATAIVEYMNRRVITLEKGRVISDEGGLEHASATTV